MTSFRFRPVLFCFLLSCIFSFTVLIPAASVKAEPAGVPAQPARPPFTLSATPAYQLPASLNHGGKVDVTALFLDFSYNTALSQELGFGVHASYDFADYHFTGPVALSGTKPWADMHRLELGTSISYDITPELSLYVMPSLQFSREGDAIWGDSLGYGGIASISYDFSPKLTLGAGVGAFSNIRDVNVFPVLMVKWQITDRLQLSNPLRPGPTGPAGLELSYSPADTWSVATGSAYRSSRFRLGNAGTVKEGIGESNSLPVFGRLTWKPAKAFNMDLYGGAMFGGALYVNDRNGNQLSSDHYDPAPFFAAAFSGHF